MKVSDCCGAPVVSNGDFDTEDFGICSDCKEHCEYINEDYEPTDEQIFNISGWEGGIKGELKLK